MVMYVGESLHLWIWHIHLAQFAQLIVAVCLLHHNLNVSVISVHMRKAIYAQQNCLKGVTTTKSRGSITHLHMWRPSNVLAARWQPQLIPACQKSPVLPTNHWLNTCQMAT